jgi:hypothetical protein
MASITKIPQSGSNDNSLGVLAWTNPSNITADDGTSATISYFNGASIASRQSQYLKCVNPDFSDIPSDATLDGLEVIIDRSASSDGAADHVEDLLVQLYVDAALAGDNKAATTTNWPTSLTKATYGSSSDLWNASLTVSKVKGGTNFGVMIRAKVYASDGLTTTGSVDTVEVKIYYTTAAGVSANAVFYGTNI